jgi:ATP-dependent DNA helicase PIF1
MTGSAAILLNSRARTLHSWAGIGLGKGTVSELLHKIQKTRKAWEAWRTLDILIIDEISMLTPILFEKLDAIGRHIRQNQQIFGGIQLILSGDFFQLPPIEGSQFLFESPLFLQCFQDAMIELKTVHRQESDLQWFGILQNIRLGILNDSDLKILYNRLVKVTPQQTPAACILYPVNRKVDILNSDQLQKLQTTIHEYKIQVNNPRRIQISDSYLDNFLVQNGILTYIRLAKGAHVMLTRNIDTQSGLVNGSQGIVVDFDPNDNPIVQFTNRSNRVTIVPLEYQEENSFSVFQLPLKLAWAVSIHKVQGHNLDCAQMDIGSSIFECGQIYVALSRIRSLEGVHLLSFDPNKIKVNQTVVDFYRSME